MISPADQDIIQIDGNSACHKRCSNCMRGVAHYSNSNKWELSPDAAKRAIKSMEGWYKPGNVLGLIGGEVTLHSQFEELCHVFRENWQPQNKVSLNSAPIADFDAFAKERLFDRTSGRGLWTSLGAGFYRNMETIFETFDHWNTNTHEAGGLHQALFVSREEYCKSTGMSDDEWEKNRDSCWLQRLWSSAINDKGAYPCEVMSTIDKLYFDGKHAWPVEQGWWQRKPEDFGAMKELCNYCSLAQPGPSNVDAKERDIVCSVNQQKLMQIGSPAISKGKFDAYDPAVHLDENRTIDTKDNYVAGDTRVGEANDSIKPHKLALAIVCVGRAEFLALTLPHNAKMFDEVMVVTDSEDMETRQFVSDFAVDGNRHVHGVPVPAFGDHAFNRGALLNKGLELLTNPDWIVGTDCDIFLNPCTGDFLRSHALNPGCLYYTKRFDIRIPGLSPEEPPDLDYPQHMLKEPNGYFQLFNRKALAIRDKWPNVMSEAFCSAAGVDTHFNQQYRHDKQVFVPDLEVAHIYHGAWAAMWNADEKPGTWRQLGMITVDQGLVPIVNLPAMPEHVRLTDTLQGETIELKPGQRWESIVRREPRNLNFNGRDVGYSHIYVAYKT